MRGTGRRSRQVTVVMLATLALTLGAALPAFAFDLGGSCLTSLGYSFDNDPEFSKPGYKNAITTGFNAWETQVDRYNGANGFNVTSGGGVNVFFDDLGGSSGGLTLGQAVCNGVKWVEFNDHPDAIALFDANINKLKGTAAHEAGHLFGIDHAGRNDSHDGGNPVPTMSTCTEMAVKGSLEQDDEAAVQARTDISGAFRSVTANSSFEETNAWQYWGKQDVASTNSYSGGVDGTPTYVGFKGAASSTAVYSTTRLMNARQIDWIKGRANYRKQYPGDSGHVLVVNKWRNVNYENGETCGNPDYHGASGVEQRINVVNSVGSFNTHYYTKTCVPAVSWDFCTTSGAAPGNVDAVDVRIVVYNRVRAPQGNYTWISIDRVRAMVDY